MSPLPTDIEALIESVAQFRSTLATLDDRAVREPSLLPGWSRAHVLTHIARSADSRRGLLIAARQGRVGHQYVSEEQRASGIDEGAARSPDAIRGDVAAALDRLLVAVSAHPADRWDAPGEWLGVGPRPVRRVVPSMRRELEYHHVDLAARYGPRDWPEDFVSAQLESVTGSFGERAPAFTLRLPDRELAVGDGGRVTVTGDPALVLAWLTGRGEGAPLRADPPGPLPDLPPLA